MTAAPASAVHMQVTARKLFDSDFYLALEALRSEAGGPTDTGRRFERLMRRAFETHPYEYGPERFESVWLWSDWPDRKAMGYGADIGIDLVAKQTSAYGGDLQGCGMLAIARATETEEVSVDAAGLAAKVVPFMLRRSAVAGSGPPVSELSLSGDDGRIREWVAQAHERTAVEAIESPPGFVADCDAAPGALAFANTAEAAIEGMRSVLFGWASLRVERGHDLPHLHRDAATR